METCVTYCPDFSDMCKDNFEFWDFLGSSNDKQKHMHVDPDTNKEDSSSDEEIWDFINSANEKQIRYTNQSQSIFNHQAEVIQANLANSPKNEPQEKDSKNCSSKRNSYSFEELEKHASEKNVKSDYVFWDFLNSDLSVSNFRPSVQDDESHTEHLMEIDSSLSSTSDIGSHSLSTPVRSDISGRVMKNDCSLADSICFIDEGKDAEIRSSLLHSEFKCAADEKDYDKFSSDNASYEELDRIRCSSLNSFDASLVVSPLSAHGRSELNVQKFLNDYIAYHEGQKLDQKICNEQKNCYAIENVKKKSLNKNYANGRLNLSDAPADNMHFNNDHQNKTDNSQNNTTKARHVVEAGGHGENPKLNSNILNICSAAKANDVSQLLDEIFKSSTKQISPHKSDIGNNVPYDMQGTRLKRNYQSDLSLQDNRNENLNKFLSNKKMCSNSPNSMSASFNCPSMPTLPDNSLQNNNSLTTSGDLKASTLQKDKNLLSNNTCMSGKSKQELIWESLKEISDGSVESINIEQNERRTEQGQNGNEEPEMLLPRIESVFPLSSLSNWLETSGCSDILFHDWETQEKESSPQNVKTFEGEISNKTSKNNSNNAADSLLNSKITVDAIKMQTNMHPTVQSVRNDSQMISEVGNKFINCGAINSVGNITQKRQVNEANPVNIQQRTTIKTPLVNAVPLIFHPVSTSSNLKNNTESIRTASRSVENSTAAKTKPLYLILPKSLDTSQSQNSQFLMIINNDTQKCNTSGTVILDTNAQSSYNQNVRNGLNVTLTNQASNTFQQPLSSCVQLNPPEQSFIILNEFPVTSNASSLQPVVARKPITEVGEKVKKLECLNSNNIVLSNNSNTIWTSLESNASSSSMKGGLFKPQDTNAFSNVTVTSRALNAPLTGNSIQIKSLNTQTRPEASMATYVENKQKGFYELQSRVVSKSHGSQTQKDQKRFSKVSPQSSKPIKSIALGKDKTAIQQTSVPLKIDSVLDNTEFLLGQEKIKVSFSPFTLNGQVATTGESGKLSSRTGVQQEKKNTNIPLEIHQDSNSKLLDTQLLYGKSSEENKSLLLAMTPFTEAKDSVSMGSEVIYLNTGSTLTGSAWQKETSAKQQAAPVETTASAHINPKSVKQNIIRVPVFSQNSQLSNVSTIPQKNTFAAIQELFPAPISMIPVCIVQTSHTSTKPLISKVLVLQGTGDQNTNNQKLQSNLSASKQKSVNLKKTNFKYKKTGRKTVRELLMERYQESARQKVDAPSNKKKLETKVLRPIFKYPTNIAPNAVPYSRGIVESPIDVWKNNLPSACNLLVTSALTENCNTIANSNKRPNILLLPSASRSVKDSVAKSEEMTDLSTAKECTQMEDKVKEALTSPDTPLLPPFSNDRVNKDSRPRHYDMSELEIGPLKVDDHYSTGRFRSKFKVLFTKRAFIYEFPVSKSNQVDLTNTSFWDQMARIIVYFKTVVSLDIRGRRITVQVYASPSVILGRVRNLSGLTPKTVSFDFQADGDTFWRNNIKDTLVHKIVLRKRQADKLKSYLFQFDKKFMLLCNICTLADTPQVLDHPSPLDEDFAASNPRRLFSKARRNIIRRLPLWSEEYQAKEKESEQFLQASNVCSCRISCRSVRCSCVKAAKSCGSVCLCTNCNNPLNVLESLGLNVDFALSDSCLFQNIYQIPNLLDFLQRDIKLTCCKSFARVQDCIPGTVLCPNADCNTPLEFSWCRRIICNPERNPRNHCSSCGQCCLSNGQHCPTCNRCYFVSSKCPNCPNCRDKRSSSSQRLKQELYPTTPFINESYQPFAKSSTKPEIVVLDGISSSTFQKVTPVLLECNEIEKRSVKSEADSTVQECDLQKKDTNLETIALDSEDPLDELKPKSQNSAPVGVNLLHVKKES